MSDENDARRPMTAAELRAMAGLPPAAARLAVVPDEDLRAVVTALMEILHDARDGLHQYGAGLRMAYERFAYELRRSGFRVDVVASRHARAAAQRRLGELAEARGNVALAMAFYDLALGSWPEVGCRRRLE